MKHYVIFFEYNYAAEFDIEFKVIEVSPEVYAMMKEVNSGICPH